VKITPLDLQQYQFRKKQWNGLDPEDVKAFLELVRVEMEELLRENHALKDELKRTVQRLAEFKDREQTLKDTLLTAQKLCDDLKSQAGKEAETIIAGAEVKAQEIIHQASQRASKLQSEIRELRRQKIAFEENLRGQLQSHLKMLGVDAEKQTDLFEEKIAFLAKKEKG
jgi:cell division initiation protein